MPPNQMITENSIPNFLLKLWKLVEDAQYRQCIRWDDTGFSFHVREPYTFSKGILPLYFKHSNLNSFIRQLNMYGFRKVTNLDKGSLKQNTDQHDSLEFQHPYFVRGHAELLQYIKRKAANSKNCPEVVEPVQTNKSNMPTITMTMNGNCHSNGGSGSSPTSVETNNDLNHILSDVRLLRDKQMGMDVRLNQVKKENQALWREVGRMHQLHMKQQQIVNKLIQLLLSLVQPGNSQRLGKRHLLAIGGPASNLLNDQRELDGIAKRLRTSNDESPTQIIESLQQESERNANRNANLIIADVTDEFESDTIQCQYGNHHQQKRNSINDGINHNQIQHGNRPQSPRVNQIDIGDDITGAYQQRQHMNSLLTPTMIVPTSNCVVVSRQKDVAVSSGSEWGNNNDHGPINQPEFSEYLDFVQSDLDSLKTLLASETLNLDNEALTSLFTMADETNNLIASSQHITKETQHQNDFAMGAEIVGNEMQVYKRPEVLVPPEHGMKPQMKSQQAQNNTNSNNDNNKPAPASLPHLLSPLPPPPPSFQFFQRQSSVPAYYGGQNPLHIPGNHYNNNNFVQHTSRPIYTSCGQTLSNNQNTFSRIPATTSEEMEESNMILNSLFSSDESGQDPQQTNYSGEIGENSPGLSVRGRRRTSID